MIVLFAVVVFGLKFEGFDCSPGFPANDKRTQDDLLARTYTRCAYLCSTTKHPVLGVPDGFSFNKKQKQPSPCFCEYQMVKAKESGRINYDGKTDYVACLISVASDPKPESDAQEICADQDEIRGEMSLNAWNYLHALTDQAQPAVQSVAQPDEVSSINITFGKVVSVIDGDTLMVAASPCLEVKHACGERQASLFKVRLEGIDAPEVDATNEDEKQVATTAKKAIHRETLNKIVRLEVAEIDRSGSLLATMFLAKDPQAILSAKKVEEMEKPANHVGAQYQGGGCPAGYGEEEVKEVFVNENENRTVNQYMLDVKMARKWKGGSPNPWRSSWLKDALDKWLENEWACVNCPDSS